MTGLLLKPCKSGYVRNPLTNRCRKKCKPGYERNARGTRCVKIKKVERKGRMNSIGQYIYDDECSAGRSNRKAAKHAPKRPPRPTPKPIQTAKVAKVKAPRVKAPKPKAPKPKAPKPKVPKPKVPKRVVRVVRAVPVVAKNRPSPGRKTWKDMINAWKAGKHLPDITGSVFWETSAIKNGGNVLYKEQTESASGDLPMSLRGDSSIFKAHLKNKTSAVMFYSPSRTLLVAPPDKKKNYSHLATFYKNASQREINNLWKTVAVGIEKELKNHDVLYVSTHGTGVNWLHVRISSTPRYYVTDVLEA